MPNEQPNTPNSINRKTEITSSLFTLGFELLITVAPLLVVLTAMFFAYLNGKVVNEVGKSADIASTAMILFGLSLLKFLIGQISKGTENFDLGILVSRIGLLCFVPSIGLLTSAISIHYIYLHPDTNYIYWQLFLLAASIFVFFTIGLNGQRLIDKEQA